GAEGGAGSAGGAAVGRGGAAKAGAAAAEGKPAASGAPAARRARNAEDNGGEPEPLGYADLVGAQGGLTALLLAAREGLDETVFALLDGGADLNQVSVSDHTSPLLIATRTRHFDLPIPPPPHRPH